MDVRKLEAFCRVYELQNFSKAGDAMFLSQPTISSHVANLEEELGVKLFDRLGRKVLPTRAGEVLYESAVRIFKNLDQAKASIEMLRDKVVGELVIGCSTIPSQTLLPQVLARFSQQYPQVNFTVHTGDSAVVTQQVLDAQWPLGIVGQEPEAPELKSLELKEDVSCVVASSDAAWLPKDAGISLDDLVKLPWIMRDKGSATRNALQSALDKAGHSLHELNIRCRVQNTSEAMAHTLAGVGVGITSLLACKKHLDSGALVQLHVPELEVKRTFSLIYHGERQMFPALRAFVEFAKKGEW